MTSGLRHLRSWRRASGRRPRATACLLLSPKPKASAKDPQPESDPRATAARFTPRYEVPRHQVSALERRSAKDAATRSSRHRIGTGRSPHPAAGRCRPAGQPHRAQPRVAGRPNGGPPRLSRLAVSDHRRPARPQKLWLNRACGNGSEAWRAALWCCASRSTAIRSTGSPRWCVPRDSAVALSARRYPPRLGEAPTGLKRAMAERPCAFSCMPAVRAAPPHRRSGRRCGRLPSPRFFVMSAGSGSPSRTTAPACARLCASSWVAGAITPLFRRPAQATDVVMCII